MLPFELTKDTPYLALSGELWSVFYEYFNRNWRCYKGFLLYIYKIIVKSPRRQLPSNIRPTLVGNEIVHNSDVVAQVWGFGVAYIRCLTVDGALG